MRRTIAVVIFTGLTGLFALVSACGHVGKYCSTDEDCLSIAYCDVDLNVCVQRPSSDAGVGSDAGCVSSHASEQNCGDGIDDDCDGLVDCDDPDCVLSCNKALAVSKSGIGTVTSDPAGISCGSACAASFRNGSSVTLAATPAAGGSFLGWSGDCVGTGPCTLAMTAAHSVAAAFAQTYALSVVKNGSGVGSVASDTGGISCGAACSASYNSGSSVTLTAVASSASSFAGWSGDCTGTGPTCTVSMTAARSVTAAFNLLPCWVASDSTIKAGYYGPADSAVVISSITVGSSLTAGDYNLTTQNATYSTEASTILLRKSATPIATTTYEWGNTVSATSPAVHVLGAYLTITVAGRGVGTCVEYDLRRLLDGTRTLRIVCPR